MKESANRQVIFKSAPVWQAITQMAIPAVVTIVVMILYNMADMFFLGFTGDTDKVTAVSLVMPVFSAIMAVGSMLGGGGCALIAKAFGAGDVQQVKTISSVCLWGCVIYGSILGIGILVLQAPLLNMLGALDKTIYEFAKAYLTVIAIGAPIMIFLSSFGSIVRAEGAIKEGMIGNLLSTVTNIILDPIFILILNQGVGGVAIATVIGNIVGSAYILSYIISGRSVLTVKPIYFLQKPQMLFRTTAVGLPNAASTWLSSFAGATANRLLVPFGTDAVAAMAAAGKPRLLISMVQMGICMGTQPLLGYCYGQKNILRLREIIRKLLLLTISIGTILTILCFLNGKALVALFLREEGALQLGQQMVRITILAGPFWGIYYLSTNFLQSSGNAKLATFTSVLRQGLILLPLLFLMNAVFGMYGNIYAHLVADISATTIASVLAFRQYRKFQNSRTAEVR